MLLTKGASMKKLVLFLVLALVVFCQSAFAYRSNGGYQPRRWDRSYYYPTEESYAESRRY